MLHIGYQDSFGYNYGIHNSVFYKVSIFISQSEIIWQQKSNLIINSLALFSSARRIEVFAATSAFAAVQVVYGTVNQ